MTNATPPSPVEQPRRFDSAKIERQFSIDAPYWAIVLSWAMGFFLVAYIGGLVGRRLLLLCGLYSFVYSHMIWAAIIGSQRYLLPHCNLSRHSFIKRFAVVLAACSLVVGVLQSIDVLVILPLFLESLPAPMGDQGRFNALVALVCLTMAITITGLGSARKFFVGLESTLASEAEAMQRAFASEMLVQELELREQAARFEAERSNKLAAEAQFNTLKAQINPHFFFNTLNSISALARLNSSGAVNMIERLAEMFRYSLQASTRPTSTLGDELDFLRAYWEIERARFGDRIAIAIDSPNGFDALRLPHLSLQPLVENAVAHAFSAMKSGCKIWVQVAPQPGCVAISVSDNGKGLGSAQPDELFEKGLALKNIDARLRRMYGEAARLRVENNSPVGVVITIRLPFAWPEQVHGVIR